MSDEDKIELVDGVLTLEEILKFCEANPLTVVNVRCVDHCVTAVMGRVLFPEADVISSSSMLMDAGCGTHVKTLCEIDERFEDVVAGEGDVTLAYLARLIEEYLEGLEGWFKL